MGTCQSCGRDGEEVSAVQRVYLVEQLDQREGAGGEIGGPEAGEGAGSAVPGAGSSFRVEDEIEYWCWSCRESFPHVPM